jgi:hypothetical protein
VPQLGADIVQAAADGGAQLQLLRLQLRHQVGSGGLVGRGVLPVGAVVLVGVLSFTAAGGHFQGVGSERDGPARGVDDQQVFLDTHGSHPLMITTVRL